MGFFSCTELLAVYAWNAALRVILSSVRKHVMDIQSEIGSGCGVIAWMLALYF